MTIPARWRRRRACRNAGGHWWQQDGTGFTVRCGSCGARSDNALAKDGATA